MLNRRPKSDHTDDPVYCAQPDGRATTSQFSMQHSGMHCSTHYHGKLRGEAPVHAVCFQICREIRWNCQKH
jgi:hypothetical protein